MFADARPTLVNPATGEKMNHPPTTRTRGDTKVTRLSMPIWTIMYCFLLSGWITGDGTNQVL
ncbi:hypothetical protein BDN71DRAFT_467388 [Pleurotus eryngii]|uniref:Uncharacterized protein n=1 Tax=Pleurotus eryngii TaxID=5323 RepID=A0A9P5ZL59_PLEER|nr:hypothetical protein BDN71DRAFT_467388 [Pleurotus eryngii]